MCVCVLCVCVNLFGKTLSERVLIAFVKTRRLYNMGAANRQFYSRKLTTPCCVNGYILIAQIMQISLQGIAMKGRIVLL